MENLFINNGPRGTKKNYQKKKNRYWGIRLANEYIYMLKIEIILKIILRYSIFLYNDIIIIIIIQN